MKAFMEHNILSSEDLHLVNTQTVEELEQIAVESERQKLPKKLSVFKADSIKNRARKRRISNLFDRLVPPMGFDSMI